MENITEGVPAQEPQAEGTQGAQPASGCKEEAVGVVSQGGGELASIKVPPPAGKPDPGEILDPGEDLSLVEGQALVGDLPDAGNPVPPSAQACMRPPVNLRKPVSAGGVKPLSDEAVTGYTAGMWKYVPVPAKEPEPAPEYLRSAVQYPGSRITAARVRGKRHKHEGTNCDDWYEVANYEDITFIAVSDGAGSKKFSRIGARESCRAALGFLADAFGQKLKGRPGLRRNLSLGFSSRRCMEECQILASIVQESVRRAHGALEAAFYTRLLDDRYEKTLGRRLKLEDLSATLLIAVVIPASGPGGEPLVITCQIGDGMIALLNTKGPFGRSIKLMGTADGGDYSGETDFLTSPRMLDLETLQGRTRFSQSAADMVLVMTDGVADDYFPNDTEMRRLYFDLVLNGIIEHGESDMQDISVSSAQRKLFPKIPEPLAYPWVNDQETVIALQYTKRICASTGLSLEDIWEDKNILSLVKMKSGPGRIGETDDRGERLEIWLDNYVERGSFDDRTLVIAQL